MPLIAFVTSLILREKNRPLVSGDSGVHVIIIIIIITYYYVSV